MKHLPSFEDFLNEARVYGMFNDAQGKPSKLSQEILDICLKGLPKYLTDNIESVEAAGYGMTTLPSPPTISKKGGAMGVNDYTTICLIFKSPMGRSKMTDLTVGLKKRTSGPGTGYMALKPSANGHEILPVRGVAIEFFFEPEKALEKLYRDSIESLAK